jgi:hypothetical protein
LNFAVRATDARFLTLLGRYLAAFQADSGPDYYLFSADNGVSKTLAGGTQVRGKNRLYKHALTIYHGRSQDEMAARLISSVRDMITGFSDQFVRFRAAAAELAGQIVMFPSRPNPHLPALVAALARSGAGYVGDELVHLDPVLRHLHPVTTGQPLPVLLDTTDLEHFPELSKQPGRKGRTRASHEPSAVTDRVPVLLEELHARSSEGGPLGCLVFPTFDLGGPTEIRPVARAEALFGLSAALLNPEIWSDRAMIVMRDLVMGAQLYRLTVGSYEAAAEVVADVASRNGSYA